MILARKHPVAGKVAGRRARLLIAAFPVAGVLAAIFYSLALQVAGEILFGAGHLTFLGPATTTSGRHLQTRPAASSMASFRAEVNPAGQGFTAGAAARGRGVGAG